MWCHKTPALNYVSSIVDCVTIGIYTRKNYDINLARSDWSDKMLWDPYESKPIE